MMQQVFWNEAGSRGVDVAIAPRMLAMGEEALRDDEMQTVFRPRHGDIEQSPLLFDFGCRACAEVRGDAAVDGVEDEDRFPFLPLGGMDRGQDQIILVAKRHARLIARGVRGVEGQFGEEALPRRVARRDLFELKQVGQARRRIFVNALEMRLIPVARPFDFGGPAGHARAQAPEGFDKAGPIVARTRRRRNVRKSGQRIGLLRHQVEDALRRRRTHARQELHEAKAGNAVARILRESQQGEQVLDVGAVEEFQPAEFDEGMLRRVSSSSSGPL
jgi:hypothetical protein